MRTSGRTVLRMLVLALAVPAAALAGRLPRLPADRALPRGADSPGVVVFSHASHVDAAHPDCTVCHPRLFPILAADGKAPRARVRHKEMDAARQCGACHDGKRATGREDCTACHREE